MPNTSSNNENITIKIEKEPVKPIFLQQENLISSIGDTNGREIIRTDIDQTFNFNQRSSYSQLEDRLNYSPLHRTSQKYLYSTNAFNYFFNGNNSFYGNNNYKYNVKHYQKYVQ